MKDHIEAALRELAAHHHDMPDYTNGTLWLSEHDAVALVREYDPCHSRDRTDLQLIDAMTLGPEPGDPEYTYGSMRIVILPHLSDGSIRLTQRREPQPSS